MSKLWIVLDIASAPIPEAGSYLEPVSAPSNWKDEAKIAAYVAEKTAERVSSAALDIDLARVTVASWLVAGGRTEAQHWEARDEPGERAMIKSLGDMLTTKPGISTILTFGGFRFDLPLLMRRARYLGVDFPVVNLDRYRSPHVDLCELLSDRDPSRRRSLNFYCRRLGWTDLLDKPLSGEEEAQVFEHQRWDDLAASVRRDVTATYRLAKFCQVIP